VCREKKNFMWVLRETPKEVRPELQSLRFLFTDTLVIIIEIETKQRKE